MAIEMLGRRTFIGATGLAFVLGPKKVLADAGAGDAAAAGLLRYVGTPENLATPITAFDKLITPTQLFFVRSHFGPPALDPTRKLTIDGAVKTPMSLGVAELKSQFKEVTVTAVLQCAGNGRALHTPRVPGVQWGHGAMGQATFTGVRLKEVLTRAGVQKEALHVRLAGADLPPKPTVPAFIRSIPIERALEASTIIAYKMNGEDLSLAHGAPMRLIVPGWAADHWVKWLTGIHAQKTEADGFYMQTAYKLPIDPVEPGSAPPPEKMKSLTTLPVKSVIARPTEGSRAPAGTQEISGVAFSGLAAIDKVEVSTDGGKTWKPARLEGDSGVGRWQVFHYSFDQKTPGAVHAMVRARDKKGNEQPEKATWNPGGYMWNAWHSVTWVVA